MSNYIIRKTKMPFHLSDKTLFFTEAKFRNKGQSFICLMTEDKSIAIRIHRFHLSRRDQISIAFRFNCGRIHNEIKVNTSQGH